MYFRRHPGLEDNDIPVVIERDNEISLSVSVTTRPKRPGEVEGRDYHFVDLTEFNLRTGSNC